MHHGVTNWLDTLVHSEYSVKIEDYSYFKCLPFAQTSNKKLLVPCKTESITQTLKQLTIKDTAILDMSYFFTDFTNSVYRNLDTTQVASMCFGVSKGHALATSRVAYEFSKVPNYKKEVLQKTYEYDIPVLAREVARHLKYLPNAFSTCEKFEDTFRTAYAEDAAEQCQSNLIFKKNGKTLPWYMNKQLEYLQF
jgi:hypothetical protein